MKLIATKHISSQRPVGAVFDVEGRQARLLIALKVAKEHVEEKPPRTQRSSEKPAPVEKQSAVKPAQSGSRSGHNRRDLQAPQNRADIAGAQAPSAAAAAEPQTPVLPAESNTSAPPTESPVVSAETSQPPAEAAQ